jgi:hypothetical protein
VVVKVIWDSLVQPFSERHKDVLQLWLWMTYWKAAGEAHLTLETADIERRWNDTQGRRKIFSGSK